MGFVLLNVLLDVKDPRRLLPCKWGFKNGRETNRSARKNDVSFDACTEHTSGPQAACHISVTLSPPQRLLRKPEERGKLNE